MLTDEKSVLQQTQVKFVGHMITTEGVEAHQSKVEAILNMPAPTDAQSAEMIYPNSSQILPVIYSQYES